MDIPLLWPFLCGFSFRECHQKNAYCPHQYCQYARDSQGQIEYHTLSSYHDRHRGEHEQHGPCDQENHERYQLERQLRRSFVQPNHCASVDALLSGPISLLDSLRSSLRPYGLVSGKRSFLLHSGQLETTSRSLRPQRGHKYESPIFRTLIPRTKCK
jgi:hypothetical protein